MVAPETAGLQVVASGLNQPHKLTIGPDGDIYVAEAGDGVIGRRLRDRGPRLPAPTTREPSTGSRRRGR